MANGYLHHQGTKFYPAPYFPIGSIYLTVGDYNPNIYFGGTWVKMSGGYLYGASGGPGNSSYTGTGTQSKEEFTSSSTKLTAAQSGLPAHRHNVQTFPYGGSDATYYCISQTPGYNVNPNTNWRGGYAAENEAKSASEGHTHKIPAHSHTVAYIAVWVWKRTA